MKKKKAVSQLEDHLGYWMRMVSNHVSYSFAKRLETDGITVAEWVILREMFNHQDSAVVPSFVAQVTGLTRGAVSKLISRLLDKKLVYRDEAREDRRYQEIGLTALALKKVPVWALQADQNDHDFFSVLSEKQKKQLKDILFEIAQHHQLKVAPIE